MSATNRHIYLTEYSLKCSVCFNLLDYFCLHCLQMLIKLNYTRIYIHRKPSKFIYESTSAEEKKKRKKKRKEKGRLSVLVSGKTAPLQLGLIRIFILLQLPQLLPISTFLPPVPYSQLAMCQKECSVCCADSTAVHAFQLPSGTEVADVLTTNCRYRKFCFYLQCSLKETYFFSLYRALFFFPLN